MASPNGKCGGNWKEAWLKRNTVRERLPRIVDTARISSYPEWTHKDTGRRFDRILEYRVWVRREDTPLAALYAFATAEAALRHAASQKQWRPEAPTAVAWRVVYLHITALVEQDWFWEAKAKGEDGHKDESPTVWLRIDRQRCTEWPVDTLVDIVERQTDMDPTGHGPPEQPQPQTEGKEVKAA